MQKENIKQNHHFIRKGNISFTVLEKVSNWLSCLNRFVIIFYVTSSFVYVIMYVLSITLTVTTIYILQRSIMCRKKTLNMSDFHLLLRKNKTKPNILYFQPLVFQKTLVRKCDWTCLIR